MTKVLISSGFGAGWSTWSTKGREVAEYAPIIEYLEQGGDPTLLNDEHPLIVEMKASLGLDHFFTGGRLDGLRVVNVDGPYLIQEYDGAEDIITASDLQ